MAPPFPMLPDQRGLATAAQLRAAGWSAQAVRYLPHGSGQRVLPGSYAAHQGQLTTEDHLVAASLSAGDAQRPRR